MATTNIVDKDGNTIAASDATVPSDRHFRNAWTLSGKTITEDLAESKKIFQDKIREVRTPLLAAVYPNCVNTTEPPVPTFICTPALFAF